MKTRAFLVAPLLLLAVAVAACGKGSGDNGSIRPEGAPSAGSGSDGTQPGSRLQPLAFSNSDGSKAPFGWWDTQLAKPCTFDVIASGLGACIPDDVYAISYDLLGDSHANINPIFYLDPLCTGDAHGIVVPFEQSCLDYGLLRVTPPASGQTYPYPSCAGGVARPAYYSIEPYDLSKGKAYRYGVPDGGGACCSCNEITPAALKDGARLYLYSEMSPEKAKATKLVTGVLNVPVP